MVQGSLLKKLVEALKELVQVRRGSSAGRHGRAPTTPRAACCSPLSPHEPCRRSPLLCTPRTARRR